MMFTLIVIGQIYDLLDLVVLADIGQALPFLAGAFLLIAHARSVGAVEPAEAVALVSAVASPFSFRPATV